MGQKRVAGQVPAGGRPTAAAAGRSAAGASLVVLLAVGLVATACRSGSHTVVAPAAGCSTPVNERLDPASVIHLFPGAPEPHYLTDPPTSGPHRLGTPPVGVVSTPVPASRQVAMLESGFVLVQHSGRLSAQQLSTLADLAGPLVTVAPAAATLPSPVVATAWTWKLRCAGSLDPPTVAAIRGFIATHKGVGFSNGPPAA